MSSIQHMALAKISFFTMKTSVTPDITVMMMGQAAPHLEMDHTSPSHSASLKMPPCKMIDAHCTVCGVRIQECIQTIPLCIEVFVK